MSADKTTKAPPENPRPKTPMRSQGVTEPFEDGSSHDLPQVIHELRTSRRQRQAQADELQQCRRQLAEVQARFEHLHQKYTAMFQFAPVSYLVIDHKNKIREVNLTAAMVLKAKQHDLEGQSFVDFIDPTSLDIFYFHQARCIESNQPMACELQMMKTDATPFSAHIISHAFLDEGVSQVGLRLAFIDISEKLRLTRDLALSNRCLQMATATTELQPMLEGFVSEIKSYMACDAVGIRLLDRQGRIPYQAYDGFSRQFYDQESPLALKSDRCMCIDVIKGQTNPAKPFFTAQGSFYTNASSRLLATIPPKQLGTTRNVCNAQGYESVALIPIRFGQHIMGLIHVADRQTNRVPEAAVQELELVAKRLGMAIQRLSIQERLDLTIRDLAHLSTRLLKAQEEEQQRIAMELHDQTGQDLNVLKLRLANIGKALRKDQPALKAVCRQAETFIDKIIEDVRRLSQGLNPALLEALGLTAAVKALADEFRQYTGIAVSTDVDALDHIAKHGTRVALYRIVQEALSNIQKHAHAAAVRINARRQNNRIVIEISDDGCGFEPDQYRQIEPQKRGMGLAAIGLRARMISADIDVTSAPGQGTRIKLTVPIRKEAGLR